MPHGQATSLSNSGLCSSSVLSEVICMPGLSRLAVVGQEVRYMYYSRERLLWEVFWWRWGVAWVAVTFGLGISSNFETSCAQSISL